MKVQEFHHDCKLSAVFLPDRRWEKEPGAIVARAILPVLSPLSFSDGVRCRVQLEDPSSDSYRVAQLTEEMSPKTWAIIDECQHGARSSGRGGKKYLSGDGRRSFPQVVEWVPLAGLP